MVTIVNPIKMNDLKIKTLFILVFSIQISFIGSVFLDTMGVHLLMIRELLGAILILFLPGILILRILRIHNLNSIKTLLYAVGLSITILMFSGFLINLSYFLFNISKPFLTWNLIIFFNVLIISLCFISYFRDRNFQNPNFLNIEIFKIQNLVFLIPFVSILGTYLVNFYQINFLLVLLMILIGIVVILIAFDKIDRKMYPPVILIISVSLLLHNSLISQYIWGWDIHDELYFSELVINNLYWDFTIYSGVNAMLSVPILAPIISKILNMDITWVLKVIYPLLFSLVPLGLYELFKKQTNEKIAILSCFFFVALFTFYFEMLTVARQQIAELFVVLILLVFMEELDTITNKILLIAFSISLIVSHYALSYIYLFLFFFVFLVSIIDRSPIKSKFYSYINKYRNNTNETLNKKNLGLNLTFVLLFAVFTVAWYIYVSDSSLFDTILRIGNQISSNIFDEFLNSEASQGLSLITSGSESMIRNITKYLHLIAQFLIFIGLLNIFLFKSKYHFKKFYVLFALFNLLLLIAGILVPYFASSLNTTRLYQISLIILAPFFVIGGQAIFGGLNRILKIKINKNSSLRLLSIFLVVFFLFNSGLIYEITNDGPSSISLSQVNIKNYGSIEDKSGFYSIITPEENVFSAKWLNTNVNLDKIIYASYNDGIRVHALASYGMIPKGKIRDLNINSSRPVKDSYIFLQYLNIVEKIGTKRTSNRGFQVYNMTEDILIIQTYNKIYSNGGSEIYNT